MFSINNPYELENPIIGVKKAVLNKKLRSQKQLKYGKNSILNERSILKVRYKP